MSLLPAITNTAREDAGPICESKYFCVYTFACILLRTYLCVYILVRV